MTRTATENLLASLVARKSRAGLRKDERRQNNEIGSARVEERSVTRKNSHSRKAEGIFPDGNSSSHSPSCLQIRIFKATVSQGIRKKGKKTKQKAELTRIRERRADLLPSHLSMAASSQAIRSTRRAFVILGAVVKASVETE